MAKYKINSKGSVPKYNIRAMARTPEYIVVHYTDGTGSAENNVTYFRGGDRQASADFFIDSTSIWRFNPNVAKYYTWHCGDGGGKYGITNQNSIGIEVVSDGRKFTLRERRRLRWLVKRMMRKYGIPASKVVRHYDASRKLCPAPYIDAKKWKKLHDYIVK